MSKLIEKKDVNPNSFDEKKKVSAEPNDELIKILIEMKQEQQKSNKIIKRLFIGLILFLIPTIITIMSFTIQISQYVF